ncbi:FUSC family protein [Estrella lausannensis]|uniref:Conserved putative membrane protein n=1 Tax=Estrella lausannensis TaxID=483423 RepID=A0A0H5DSI7_9BACT|nr:aromatic acid exporter family protein [Estrella lausannensis]CRX38744.1 Conserved putative membrane protein [Estrella lausannensis]
MKLPAGKYEIFLENLQLHFALKIGVAATLGLFLGVGFSQILDRPDSLVSGMWAVVTAIVVVQGNLGSTYMAAWVRFLGTLIGTMMAGICTTLFGSNAISLGFSNFITVALCSVFQIKDSVRIASLTVTVLMVLWRLRPEISPWAFGFFRLMDSCLGILVAVVVTHTLFPLQATSKLKECLSLALAKIRLLYRECLYKEDLPSAEREEQMSLLIGQIEEHLKEARQTLEDSKTEIRTRSSVEDWSFFLDHTERAHEAVLDLLEIKKSPLSHFLNREFREKISKVVGEIDLSIEEIVSSLEEGNEQLKSDLPAALLTINDELFRFKEGSFNESKKIAELQNLFVFIYSLRSLGEELNKLKGRLNVIIR